MKSYEKPLVSFIETTEQDVICSSVDERIEYQADWLNAIADWLGN